MYNCNCSRERKEGTREPRISTKELTLQDIGSRFDNNIGEVKKLFNIADYLAANKMQDEVSDIFRAQVVFLESSLDSYFHDILTFVYKKNFFTRSGYSKVNKSRDEFSKDVKELKISLKAFSNFWHNSMFGVAGGKYDEKEGIEKLISKELSYSSFMNYSSISNACDVAGIPLTIVEQEQFKRTLTEVAKRRNQIVHQTDRENSKSAKEILEKETVQSYIDNVCKFKQLVQSKIESNDITK